ncbi:MAG: hypothetical protein ACM3JB_01105 [Acidobacteriaceae bacterium]
MTSRYLFKTLTSIQLFIFLMFFFAGLFMFAMSRPFGPETATNLEKSGLIALLISPLWLIPLVGIWKRARWAWWLGLIVNFLSFGIAYWALIYSQPDADWTSIIGVCLFLAAAVLHLLSRPRSWIPNRQHGSVISKKVV